MTRSSRKPSAARTASPLMGACLILLLGCLGGGSQAPAPAGPLPPGNYQLAVEIEAPPAPATALVGLDLTLALPPGVTVATLEGGRIAPEALQTGSAVPGEGRVDGICPPGAGTARITLLATASAPWSGQGLRLAFAASRPFTEQAIQDLNTPLPACKAVGYDRHARATVLLTPRVRITLKVAAVPAAPVP